MLKVVHRCSDVKENIDIHTSAYFVRENRKVRMDVPQSDNGRVLRSLFYLLETDKTFIYFLFLMTPNNLSFRKAQILFSFHHFITKFRRAHQEENS